MNNPNSLLVCIQARMGSKRLPGKSLATLEGKASLEYLIESACCSVPKEQIVILSSVRPENVAIQKLCGILGVRFFAGDEDNVASRYLEVIQRYRSKKVLRLNGDSPLWDHRVLDLLLDCSKKIEADLYTTVGPEGYPSGSHAELFSANTFMEVYRKFGSQEDFEHVTHYFYQHPQEFFIERLPCPFEFDRSIKLSLDTDSDLQLLEKFFKKLKSTNKKLNEINLEDRIKMIQNLSQIGE